MATASTSPPGSKALAEPGGIVLSAAAFDQVTGKLPVTFRDLGERSLKNIARPVHVYAVGDAATRWSSAVRQARDWPIVAGRRRS